MSESAEKVQVHRGLKGVYFERFACTFIDGRAGELRYRGYSIHDLAESSSFEETAYLLIKGALPRADELAGFDRDLLIRPRTLYSGPEPLPYPPLESR